jgi:hypothetical protein
VRGSRDNRTNRMYEDNGMITLQMQEAFCQADITTSPRVPGFMKDVLPGDEVEDDELVLYDRIIYIPQEHAIAPYSVFNDTVWGETFNNPS